MILFRTLYDKVFSLRGIGHLVDIVRSGDYSSLFTSAYISASSAGLQSALIGRKQKFYTGLILKIY